MANSNARTNDERHDWRHVGTRIVLDKASLVMFQDLSLANMTRSARGNADEPRSNVEARSVVDREIMAIGLERILSMLDCTTHKVVDVNPQHTS